MLYTGLPVWHYRRSDSNKWQCGVGNAQSITANNSITFTQTSSDNVHLPDMLCERKNETRSLISIGSIKKGAAWYLFARNEAGTARTGIQLKLIEYSSLLSLWKLHFFVSSNSNKAVSNVCLADKWKVQSDLQILTPKRKKAECEKTSPQSQTIRSCKNILRVWQNKSFRIYISPSEKRKYFVYIYLSHHHLVTCHRNEKSELISFHWINVILFASTICTQRGIKMLRRTQLGWEQAIFTWRANDNFNARW